MLKRIVLALLVFLMLPAVEVLAEVTKVGFIYAGNRTDQGWTYAHELARQRVAEHFGDQVITTYVDNVPEGAEAADVLRQMIKDGNEIIFITSMGFIEPTLQVAKEFPKVRFEQITGDTITPNVAISSIRFYEGRYVQGVVAGLMTKTNKIGYIASIPIPEVIRGINSFSQGLKSVNPEASISVIWVDSWYDPIKEKEAAATHIANGADILPQHTNSIAIIRLAEQEGVYGFGQAVDMSVFAPKGHLFSTLNYWDTYHIERINAHRNGTWQTGDTWGGFADNMLKLAPFRNMPPEVAAKAQATLDGIQSGEITIFEGPIYDNKGKTILKAGEVLDDSALITMDYYFEGVEGSVPK